MGLIKAALGAAGGVLADQWKDYFRCDAIDANVLVTKGRKSAGGRSSNTKGTEGIITSGSVILVADGQCMMIVDQGRIAEFAAEPGEYTYDASTEPSIFSGDLDEAVSQSFASFVKRFSFGGEPAKDQRVYYFNTKELVGNKYGTPTPVPFRVVDNNIGLDMEVSLRCFGTYSYRICDPVLFYKNVCGNVSSDYTREQLDGQLKSELLTALAPAFAKISAMGIRYSALMAHTTQIAAALNEVLSSQWRAQRGLEIVTFGVSSVSASPEDEAAIKELQRAAALRAPGTDFWVALGYDFVRFAVRMAFDSRPPAATVNAQAANMKIQWAMAPLSWDEKGIAHQKLHLFQPGANGMEPLDLTRFRNMREAILQRAALRMQGLPTVDEQGNSLIPGLPGMSAGPAVLNTPAATSPTPGVAPLSTTPQPSYKLRLSPATTGTTRTAR